MDFPIYDFFSGESWQVNMYMHKMVLVYIPSISDADLTDFDFFFAVAKDAAAGAARFAATADSLINDMRSGRKAPTIILVFWMKQTLLPSAVERGQGIRLSQPSSGNLACVVWTESRTNQLLARC